ncbi:MAG: hypothetical protein JRF64_05040 [Deltaproteobacteria bacterium]|jgi:hypothetical protein|nr:hypothetical protein [Deltaproteobacteria bacterium]
MEQAYMERIGELVKDCPGSCKCHTQGVENLCKASDVGLETLVECKEDNPSECNHSVYYGQTWYCSCHPRVFIAKVFGK